MKGVRNRPNAQREADEESISGLSEWIKRQPGILQRGIRLSDAIAIDEPIKTGRPWIAYRRSRDLPEGAVLAFDEHDVLLAMAVV